MTGGFLARPEAERIVTCVTHDCDYDNGCDGGNLPPLNRPGARARSRPGPAMAGYWSGRPRRAARSRREPSRRHVPLLAHPGRPRTTVTRPSSGRSAGRPPSPPAPWTPPSPREREAAKQAHQAHAHPLDDATHTGAAPGTPANTPSASAIRKRERRLARTTLRAAKAAAMGAHTQNRTPIAGIAGERSGRGGSRGDGLA